MPSSSKKGLERIETHNKVGTLERCWRQGSTDILGAGNWKGKGERNWSDRNMNALLELG